MITVIVGSNRHDSGTGIFSRYIFDRIKEKSNEKVLLFDMAEMTGDMLNAEMYSDDKQPKSVRHIQDEYFVPADKFWFITPEYNGSFPGSLKLLIDAMSIRNAKETFFDKKACLTGVASGRAGNLRGMDHLADVLNHLGIHTMPLRLPISQIFKLWDKNKKIVDEGTVAAIDDQLEKFLKF